MDAYEAVSPPPKMARSGRKFFTRNEANRALPLVRRIVNDIVVEYQRVLELRDACREQDRAHSREAEHVRGCYLGAADRLAELNEELEKIGCELKDLQTGLVDFPGLLEGREICLCWKLGEDRIEYWHEIDTGFAGRQPCLPESV